MKLSICTYAGDVDKLELPFRQVIESALPIADEMVVINSDDDATVFSKDYDYGNYFLDLDGSTHEAISKFYGNSKIKYFCMPFPKRLRKNCYVIQRSNAIAQCTGDYILLLDGDEVLHEKDYSKIKQAMELGYDAYTFRVNHFYRDYNHVKTSDWWYKKRPYLFKNNLGIFDGYRSWTDNGKLVTEYTSDLTTWDYKPVMDFAKQTSIEVFHYGYVRSNECMLNKQNEMETWFHDDYKNKKEWIWDMSDTAIYSGTHPKIMETKIKEHKLKHKEYYE